jgi:hypothetical protein
VSGKVLNKSLPNRYPIEPLFEEQAIDRRNEHQNPFRATWVRSHIGRNMARAKKPTTAARPTTSIGPTASDNR